jgi:single-strand DNA-binding protein
MAELKMPEVNSVIITGNLTRDPIFRQTATGAHVINFLIASNRKYRDVKNQWQEEVSYIGIVAWNRLAESCARELRRGSAVVVDGELQSHSFKNDDGIVRHIVEVKARRIQFLNKKPGPGDSVQCPSSAHHDDEPLIVEDDSFDKFLSSEETQLLKEQTTNHT